MARTIQTVPMIPRIMPAVAIPPPLTVPPLASTRWREALPMKNATGPTIGQQMTLNMPSTSDSVAWLSVGGAKAGANAPPGGGGGGPYWGGAGGG